LSKLNTKVGRNFDHTMDLGEFTNRGSAINIDIIPEFHEYKKEFAMHKSKLNNKDLDNSDL